MKVILTEEQLKKIVSESVSEVSNQTLTNSLIAAAKKSNKYYDSGDNGMATSKMRQSDRLYDELDAKLNPSEDLNKRVKRCYFSDETATIVNGVNSYEIAGRDGNNVMGFVQVLLARENKRAYYRIIINSETRQIEKESEDDLMEDILRRVSDKALQEYNKAKKGIRSLMIGYANRHVGEYTTNGIDHHKKIGDAMRQSISNGKKEKVSKINPIH